MKRTQSALLGAGVSALVLIVSACGNNSGSSGSSGDDGNGTGGTNIPGMGGPTFMTPAAGSTSVPSFGGAGFNIPTAGASGSVSSTTP
jgi:hypothetical protein